MLTSRSILFFWIFALLAGSFACTSLGSFICFVACLLFIRTGSRQRARVTSSLPLDNCVTRECLPDKRSWSQGLILGLKERQEGVRWMPDSCRSEPCLCHVVTLYPQPQQLLFSLISRKESYQDERDSKVLHFTSVSDLKSL